MTIKTLKLEVPIRGIYVMRNNYLSQREKSQTPGQ